MLFMALFLFESWRPGFACLMTFFLCVLPLQTNAQTYGAGRSGFRVDGLPPQNATDTV